MDRVRADPGIRESIGSKNRIRGRCGRLSERSEQYLLSFPKFRQGEAVGRKSRANRRAGSIRVRRFPAGVCPVCQILPGSVETELGLGDREVHFFICPPCRGRLQEITARMTFAGVRDHILRNLGVA
jgi:hypothetical protein